MKYTIRILKLIVTCIIGFNWLLMCYLTMLFLLALIGAAIQLNLLGAAEMFIYAAIAAILAAACTDFLHALLRS